LYVADSYQDVQNCRRRKVFALGNMQYSVAGVILQFFMFP
jgi:hypothetical protein